MAKNIPEDLLELLKELSDCRLHAQNDTFISIERYKQTFLETANKLADYYDEEVVTS